MYTRSKQRFGSDRIVYHNWAPLVLGSNAALKWHWADIPQPVIQEVLGEIELIVLEIHRMADLRPQHLVRFDVWYINVIGRLCFEFLRPNYL